MAPRTRDFKAMEMPDLTGRHYRLTVTGEVEVSASNKWPHLKLHGPQGFNPRILLLDLTISTEGEIGADVMTWKKVPPYLQPTDGDQFDEVDILYDGAIIERLAVSHPKTVAKKRGAKKKSARSSAKMTRKKKSAKKVAKKAAKRATKRTAKKVTKKKSAKKTAKKAKKATKAKKKRS